MIRKPAPAHANRRRPRSPGVILRGRSATGNKLWDDEISADGGKAKLHRQARRAENRQWRREAALELATA